MVAHSPVDEGVEQLDRKIEPQTTLEFWAVEYRRPVNARTFIPASDKAEVRFDDDLEK